MRNMGPALLAAAAVSSAGFLVAWGAGPGGGERPVSFGTSGGSGAVLEGVLAIPGSGSAAPAVVICHPNPMAGGSMDNPIIRDLQVAFAHAGLGNAAVQLPRGGEVYKGVRGGCGRGERCPRRSGVRAPAAGRRPGTGVFGGLLLWRDAGAPGLHPRRPRRGLRLFGFPARGKQDIATSAYFRNITFPTVFVAGTEDAVCKLGALEDIVRAYGAEKLCRLEPIEGANHLLAGVGQRGIAVKHIIRFVTKAAVR